MQQNKFVQNMRILIILLIDSITVLVDSLYNPSSKESWDHGHFITHDIYLMLVPDMWIKTIRK